jgi:RNA polymerase sigma-70 factor (ECF subfamily)
MREDTGETQVITKESISDIQKTLKKLPEHLWIVMILKEFALLNYEEIGRVLGISEGNVKVRVFRARIRLAALLPD